MKDAIAAVIESGGVVHYGVKWKPPEHVMTAKIGKLTADFMREWRRDGRYYVSHPYKDIEYFATAAEAAEVFIGIVFTKKNLALCYDGVRNHDLSGGKDLDDLTEAELEAAVALYRKSFWTLDYPMFKG